MKKEIFEEIEVPKGIDVKIEGNVIIINGKNGENKKKLNINKLILEKKDNKITIGSKTATKKEKRIINTNIAHIKNMMKGVQNVFEYKLKIGYSHFPINIEFKEKEAIIKNFLGEKVPRKVKILDSVNVKVDNGVIIISSHNKELAGQTAANFEKSTRIRMKDRRVFQDGIFIINKAGKEI